MMNLNSNLIYLKSSSNTYVVFTFLLILLFSSCRQDQPVSVSEIILPPDSKEMLANTLVKLNTTKLVINHLKINEVLDTSFIIKNVGKFPLYIKGVRSGCSCTVMSYPKSSILPNQNELIKLKFHAKELDSENPEWQGTQIAVSCNTDQSPIILTLEVHVYP